jgi:hypothetical protein
MDYREKEMISGRIFFCPQSALSATLQVTNLFHQKIEIQFLQLSRAQSYQQKFQDLRNFQKKAENLKPARKVSNCLLEV